MARYQRTPIAFWIIIFIAVCATGLLLFSVREHFASQATMTLYYSPTCPHCVNIMPAARPRPAKIRFVPLTANVR